MGRFLYYCLSILELLFGVREVGTVIRIFLSRKPPGLTLLHLRKTGLAVLVRGKMDVWSLKETFIDRFYTRYGSEIQDGWTVVDIGAAIGEFSMQAALGHPHARVIAYEPFQESVEILRRNLELNDLRNVQIVPKAVWKTAGKLSLDLSRQEPLKITSSQAGPVAGEHVEVGAISLADVLTSNRLERVDLLKLDCEGAEFDLLLESDGTTIQRFNRIVMEYHDSPPARQHTMLAERLAELGFEVTSRQNVVHADLGYLFADQM